MTCISCSSKRSFVVSFVDPRKGRRQRYVRCLDCEVGPSHYDGETLVSTDYAGLNSLTVAGRANEWGVHGISTGSLD